VVRGRSDRAGLLLMSKCRDTCSAHIGHQRLEILRIAHSLTELSLKNLGGRRTVYNMLAFLQCDGSPYDKVTSIQTEQVVLVLVLRLVRREIQQ